MKYPALFSLTTGRHKLMAVFYDRHHAKVVKSDWDSYQVGYYMDGNEDCEHPDWWKPVTGVWVDGFGVCHDLPKEDV